MSVELLNTTRFFGFRVRRQIDGQTFQEYFSLKKNGKRLRGEERSQIQAKAENRDGVLAKLQKKTRMEAHQSSIFNTKGKVRGILFRMKKEKNGTRTPIFQIGIMSLKLDKVVNTTVSINLHGLKGAWLKAVFFYIEHKKISQNSILYKKLLRAQPSNANLEELKKTSRRR